MVIVSATKAAWPWPWVGGVVGRHQEPTSWPRPSQRRTRAQYNSKLALICSAPPPPAGHNSRQMAGGAMLAAVEQLVAASLVVVVVGVVIMAPLRATAGQSSRNLPWYDDHQVIIAIGHSPPRCARCQDLAGTTSQSCSQTCTEDGTAIGQNHLFPTETARDEKGSSIYQLGIIISAHNLLLRLQTFCNVVVCLPLARGGKWPLLQRPERMVLSPMSNALGRQTKHNRHAHVGICFEALFHASPSPTNRHAWFVCSSLPPPWLGCQPRPSSTNLLALHHAALALTTRHGP
ncbi:uncharacterized protein B0I36DRAFT_70323 [Microdochium trichocladiopsis]|uniref:Uncharacterized protein n=1 Tax=Microdochium trichocladiopsis TaxID=1682393 RepID=A0A9P9BSB5_9PEZI|nr:uncharacterized protein B0I36DRAFT_70323 [Microdochium trichocladiopsis]KAH7037735.1 hypothetical protein B0I36DRAFT_70323 [Microdochium trichocladiopsis]